MARRYALWMMLLWIGLGLSACVTVNIYFPAAKVERAAEKIVDDVYGDQNATSPSGDQNHSVLDRFWEWLSPQKAWAQNAATVSNAAIRGLKATIRQHHQQLKPFYNQGVLGITKDGYLQIRNKSGLNLGQVAKVRKLIQEDNQARKQLYKEVVKAMGLDSANLGRVEDIFAKQWQNKAASGWWVQKNNGQWVQK